jgi:gamma-glutamylcyclotransferase (GGCT)/AIG2-like uncharacterized protein YtfP
VTRQHLVLYGSLRAGQPSFARLGLGRRLKRLGPVRFRGRMYDLGDYPGVVLAPGAGLVCAELHRITDPGLLTELDAFELYRPNDPGPYDPSTGQGSLFVRETIRLGGVGAQVYLYNGVRGRSEPPIIASGDWLAHLAAQASNSRPMPA